MYPMSRKNSNTREDMASDKEFGGEAGAMDTILVTCTVEGVSMSVELNVNMEFGDVKECILESFPDAVNNQATNSWVLFYVHDKDETKLDDDDGFSNDMWTNLSSNAYLRLVDTEDTGGMPRRQVMNVRPLEVTVVLPDREVLSPFTMDHNLTLPATSVIDGCLQHQNVINRIGGVVTNCKLFVVNGREDEHTLEGSDRLDSLNQDDYFSNDISLRVEFEYVKFV